MNILITGSAGFIGFHTAKYFLNLGWNVFGIDNFNDYYDVSLKEDRNAILSKFENFKLHRGDLADFEFLNNVFKENKIDKICHLAAQAGVRYSLENPRAYIKSNIDAFVNILEVARLNNIKDVVYASSSSVYGDNKKIPFSVFDNTDKPISFYAATKKADELIAYSYSYNYKINLTGLRFFTVIGPYGRPDMSPFLFAKAIFGDSPIKVFNFGKMKRDFTYVDDIVEGIYLAFKNMDGYKIFNLGNNNSVELEYFISCFEKNIGKKAIKQYEDMQPGDLVETCAEIDNTQKELNWLPKTSVDDAVSYFIDWYKKYYYKRNESSNS